MTTVRICSKCGRHFSRLGDQARQCLECAHLYHQVHHAAAAVVPEEVMARLRECGYRVYKAPRKIVWELPYDLIAKKNDYLALLVSFNRRKRPCHLVARATKGSALWFAPTCRPACKGCRKCLAAAELNRESLDDTRARRWTAEDWKHGVRKLSASKMGPKRSDVTYIPDPLEVPDGEIEV